MNKESLEDLRERLLNKETVHQMIRARAYEIYQLRGGQPGGEAHDWLQAEGEVLAFLIAHESSHIERVSQENRAEVSQSDASTKVPASKESTSLRASKATEARQSSPRKTSAKRTTHKKSTKSKARQKRTPKQPGSEKSTH